jgi:serine/threonine protein kinase
MIGREIGTYKILEKIGEGGMGVVYKGIDTGLDRLVAVKVLTPDLARNPELIERFRSEAKAQANLNHTNIATLYAFMQIEGECLIVMEYLEGETFEDLLLRGGKLPWKDAASLTRQALSGLGFAHNAGIVHRDIKPSNLMLTTNGTVKVMDFGIAKALGVSKKTRTGMQMGTPHYMSPEQIRGRPVDARSDIYSLGVTLYQLLTGDLPFQSDSDFELMSAHINTPPPIMTDSHADIPKGIEQCVMKALAKEPENRYQSADNFGTGLEQASRLPTDLLEVNQVEELPLILPETGKTQPAARKTVVEQKKTMVEREIPRTATVAISTSTPAPALSQTPPPQPAPRAKTNVALIGIAAAAVLGAALTVTFWSKWHQPVPTPLETNKNPVVQPQPVNQVTTVTKPVDKTQVVEPAQKPTPDTKPAPEIQKAPVAATIVPPTTQRANLYVLCNLDCTWTLDGKPQGQLASGRAVSVKVPLGSHTITASTTGNQDQADDVTFVASSPNQPISQRLDLQSKQTQRLQLEAAEKQHQADAAKLAEQQRIAALQKQPTAVTTPPLSSGAAGNCGFSTMPQIWRNVATNGRYSFRFDCEHVYIYELPTNRIVADLTLKKNKKDSSKDKYVGTTALSNCRGGGRMEISNMSPTRIETKVEVPNPANNMCTQGGFSFFATWASASFIPE